MTSSKKALILFGALILALLPAAAFSATRTVVVEGASWSTPRLRVTRGDTVQWRNDTFQTHTVVSYASSWSKNEVLDPYGGSTSHRFRSVGIYKYRCTEHSVKRQGEPCQGMCGQVKVVRPG